MAEPAASRPRRASGSREQVISLAGFRAAASIFAERLAFGSRHGVSYDGARDLYAALGYKRLLTPQDYRDRFERGGLAKRVVSIYPKATWRGGVELIEDGDPKNLTEFEQAWVDLEQRLGAVAVLQRADILARLGRYAIVLIGAEGNPEEELPHGLGPDGVKYLAPYGEYHVAINTADIETDPASERWGLPKAYVFNPIGITDAPGIVATAAPATDRIKRIHWTRVVHLAEAPLENPLYGEPALCDVWNYFDDLDKIVGGGSESFWLRANPGLNLDVDPTIPQTAGAISALEEQVDKYLHQYRRTLQTRGVNVKQLQADVASIGAEIDALVGLIAATKSIPQRILAGSEAGQFGAGQDDAEWREKVQDRRGSYAEPVALRPLADRLIKYGALPEPTDGADRYECRWSEWRDLSLDQRVELASKMASANQSHAAARPGEILATADEIRERAYGFDPLGDVAPEEDRTGLDPGELLPGTPDEAEGAPEEEGATGGPLAAARRRRLQRHGRGSTRPRTAGSAGSGT